MNSDFHPDACTRCRLTAMLLALLVLVADQFSKHVVRFFFLPGDSRTIFPAFFDLAYVRNTGAVWGSLQNQNEWLALVSIVVLVAMIFSQRWLCGGQMFLATAIGLIMGGIAGNLVDRIKLGWVTDFLDFYWRNFHWPAFNVADAAICLGVGIYLVASLRPRTKNEHKMTKVDSA